MSLWLNPEHMAFGDARLENVRSVRIERKAGSVIAESGDNGPNVTFADATALRTEVVVEQDITGSLEPEPLPGMTGLLRFEVALGRGDGHRRSISLTVVAVGNVLKLEREKSARREMRFVAVSDDAAVDPIHVEEADA